MAVNELLATPSPAKSSRLNAYHSAKRLITRLSLTWPYGEQMVVNKGGGIHLPMIDRRYSGERLFRAGTGSLAKFSSMQAQSSVNDIDDDLQMCACML